ncbi:hypothetical protein VTN77DRAFT_2479 [Rasamsonia byssochlamydoides]|uniref:uncharacterized protein n=1 Tax=Rasamsonia byssochlamydoides TaxID=89139 RepID=UPI00374435FC
MRFFPVALSCQVCQEDFQAGKSAVKLAVSIIIIIILPNNTINPLSAALSLSLSLFFFLFDFDFRLAVSKGPLKGSRQSLNSSIPCVYSPSTPNRKARVKKIRSLCHTEACKFSFSSLPASCCAVFVTRITRGVGGERGKKKKVNSDLHHYYLLHFIGLLSIGTQFPPKGGYEADGYLGGVYF